MGKRMLVTLAVVSLALLLVACGGPAPSQEPAAAPTEAIQQQEELTAQPPAADGAILLEERCTACHSLDRVMGAQKSHDEWAQTVARMVGKGAQLNENEQAVLVDYLVKTYGP